MNFELSEDQRAFQETARHFAINELAPHAAHWYENAIFPVDAIRRAGELGFCGLYTEERWGGLSLSRLDASIVIEELAAACPSTAAFITIHNMATWMLTSNASENVASEWGPLLASGEKLASYCLTEPSAGPDAGSLRTMARLENGMYVLNGAKAFISGAGETHVLVVMARTGGDGPSGISAFVVLADTPGVIYGRKEQKMGWNSQPTRGITFENARVPACNLMGNRLLVRRHSVSRGNAGKRRLPRAWRSQGLVLIIVTWIDCLVRGRPVNSSSLHGASPEA